MLQIVEVELQTTQHLLHRVGVAVVERGVRGHARSNLIEIDVARVVLNDLVDVELAFRSWTDKGHVAFEHVPKLGQLIEMMVTEEAADLRHAVIAVVIGQLRAMFLGIHLHASELIDVERFSIHADSLLLEDGGTTIFALYQQIA